MATWTCETDGRWDAYAARYISDGEWTEPYPIETRNEGDVCGEPIVAMDRAPSYHGGDQADMQAGDVLVSEPPGDGGYGA